MAAVTQVRILVTASRATFCFTELYGENKEKNMRRPGIEPGSTAWKAAMLTIIPPTLVHVTNDNISITLGIITEEMSQTATRVICVHMCCIDQQYSGHT